MFLTLMMACSSEQPAEADLFVEDVEEMARALEQVGMQPQTFSECSEGPGACTSCLEATGTPLSGTWTVDLETSPCEVTDDNRGYTVEDSSFGGDWAAALDGVAVSMSGTRSVRPSGEGSDTRDFGATTLTAEGGMTLDADGEVTAFSLSGTYAGLAGRTTTFDVAETNGELTGSLSGTNLSCTVSGTRDAPLVACGD